jgi:hypothetical protein
MSIIKEAIADANTVTSVIEERAKNMFIKEFSPQIKNMLSAVINEEVSTGSDQPGGYNPEEDKDALGDGTNINKGTGAGPIETYPEGKDVNEEEDLPVDKDDPLYHDEPEDESTEIPSIEDDDKEDIPIDEFDNEPKEKQDDLDFSTDDDEVLEVVDDEEDESKKKEDETIETDGDGSEEKGKDEVLEQVKKIARKYKKENALLRETINTLRNKFEKVDLFNAKLAYAFKLMTQPGMSRSEKKQIAEAFDNAKTTREAQLIYKTMRKTPSIAKTVNPLKNVNKKSVISESTKLKNIQVDRMSELAGLE